MKKTCLTTTEIEARLVAAGIQPTAQRIAICQFVLCEADHPTADDVKAWADKNFPKMSLATVYNTLNALVDAKLLKELKFAHSDKAFYDDNVAEHYHFLDQTTGELFDVAPSQCEVQTKLGRQFKIDEVEVLFKGRRVAR